MEAIDQESQAPGSARVEKWERMFRRMEGREKI